MRKFYWVLTASMAFSAAAFAQTGNPRATSTPSGSNNDLENDKQNVNQDQQELKRAEQRVQMDQQWLAADRAGHASKEQIQADKEQLKQDQQQLDSLRLRLRRAVPPWREWEGRPQDRKRWPPSHCGEEVPVRPRLRRTLPTWGSCGFRQ